VIKTLALPKLIHLFTSLPNLKQSLFNDLNKLFFILYGIENQKKSNEIHS
jgi:hypothetical protein